MKTHSLTTLTLLLFFFSFFTISHALYLFTDLTHLANVDIDADDDYRGSSTFRPKPAAMNTAAKAEADEMEERERLSSSGRNPAGIRFFPRQCRHHHKSRVMDQNVVEFMLRRNAGLEMGHVGGRLSNRGGAHGRVFQRGHVARFPGADVEERGEMTMMMMYKRPPHYSTPRQRMAHRHVNNQRQKEQQQEEAVSKREEETKREEREEEARREKVEEEKQIEEPTEGESAVIKKIRKFLGHF